MCQGCPIEDIVAQLNAALPHAKVSALQQAVRARLQTVERLSRFSTALSAVMLLIGFVIVFITMINTVADQAIADSIPVHERMEALSLIHDGSRCFGAVVRDLDTG